MARRLEVIFITSSAGPLFGIGKSQIGRCSSYDWYNDA
jgi:hypothetical protein